MSHHWRSVVGRPDAIQGAGGTGFPKARQPDQPGRKTYPAPCKHAWQGRIGPIAMLRGSRPSTKLCEGIQYRHPSQTSGRSSTLNSVRTCRVALADATIKFDFFCWFRLHPS
jgi:hypothetical protein